MKTLLNDKEFMDGYNDWVFQECEEWRKNKEMLFCCPNCGIMYKTDKDMMHCPCLFEKDRFVY